MATDREESIRSAARAYADSMGHGDACDLTLYGACDMTLYGEEYRCDCGYAALRSALAQPAAPEAGSAGAMREACAIETDRLYAHPTPPRAEGVERADRVVALEDSIRRWHHEKYGRAALIAPTVRKLGEEFGEFCEAAVKGDVPAMTEEAADVALILTNLVRAVGGGSLFDAMETKHEVCKQRLAAERGEG